MTHPLIIELIYDLQQLVPLLRRVWVAVLAVVLAALTLLSPLGWPIEIFHLRGLFWLRGEREPPPDIVLVGLDEGTREAYGVSSRTVLPRELIGRGLSAVAQAKPRILIVDLCFPPQQGSEEADQMIAAALRQVPSTIWNGDLGSESKENFPPDPLFAEAARMSLSMGLPANGVIMTPMVRGAGLPSVGQALSQLTNIPLMPPPERALINFYGNSGAINYLSLAALLKLSSAEVQQIFRDKVVVFGAHEGRELKVGGAIGSDEHWVGGSFRQMSGAEIHATIAGNLIDGSWLRIATSGAALLAVMIGVGLIARFLCGLSPLYALPGLSLVGALLCGASYYAFIFRGEFRVGVLSAFVALAATMALNYLVLYRLAVTRLIKVSLTAGLALAATIKGARLGRYSAIAKPVGAGGAVLLLLWSGLPSMVETSLLEGVKSRNLRQLTAPVVQVTFSDHTMSAQQLSPGQPFPGAAVLPVIREVAAQKPRLVILDLGLVRPMGDGKETLAQDLRRQLEEGIAGVPLVLWDGTIADEEISRRVADPTYAPLYNTDPAVRSGALAVAELSFAVRSGRVIELEAFGFVEGGRRALPEIRQDPMLGRLFNLSGRQLISPYGGGGVPRYDAALFYPGVDRAIELRDRIVVMGFASVARQRGTLESTKVRVLGMPEMVFAHDVTAIRTANLLSGDGTKVFEGGLFRVGLVLAWMALMWAALFSGSYKWYPLALVGGMAVLVLNLWLYAERDIWTPDLAQGLAYAGFILLVGSFVGRTRIVGQFARIKRVIRVQLSETP